MCSGVQQVAPVDRQAVTAEATAWDKPDDGIWEVRGPRRHFVQSKVTAWLAFDSAVRLVERFELDAPLALQANPSPNSQAGVREGI